MTKPKPKRKPGLRLVVSSTEMATYAPGCRAAKKRKTEFTVDLTRCNDYGFDDGYIKIAEAPTAKLAYERAAKVLEGFAQKMRMKAQIHKLRDSKEPK